jgi:hypothetical protein
VRALAGQARCLRPGGLLAALYFPATPVGGGPLAALHRASRLLAPRPDSPWERRAFEEIEAFTGAPVETLEVSASWRFPTLQRAQETLELLPHLGSIRERAGEGFYQHLWRTWREDPGLAPSEGGGLAGPVTARLAVAHRPSRP